MQLFYIVFSIAEAVHKFGFRLLMYWTPDKWREVESDKTKWYTRHLLLLRKVTAQMRDIPHAVKVTDVFHSQ
jgi:Ser/Thr protein kinase RdoA (MazF antagonist)